MSLDNVKPGDMFATSSKGLASNLIQLGCLSLPNIGPLGRWGYAGASHVFIVAPVFGELIAYESTSFGRPPCLRTGRENPKGVQAHRLSEILDAGGDVWHYPLRRPLYTHEEDRLLAFLESCLGKGYDFVGAGKSGGGVLARLVQRHKGSEDLNQYFCSELVVRAWIAVGQMTHKNAGAWSPQRLVRYVLRRGICDKGSLVS